MKSNSKILEQMLNHPEEFEDNGIDAPKREWVEVVIAINKIIKNGQITHGPNGEIVFYLQNKEFDGTFEIYEDGDLSFIEFEGSKIKKRVEWTKKER